jgi:hypothetical protein
VASNNGFRGTLHSVTYDTETSGKLKRASVSHYRRYELPEARFGYIESRTVIADRE